MGRKGKPKPPFRSVGKPPQTGRRTRRPGSGGDASQLVQRLPGGHLGGGAESDRAGTPPDQAHPWPAIPGRPFFGQMHQ
jgi:hypothetical protein